MQAVSSLPRASARGAWTRVLSAAMPDCMAPSTSSGAQSALAYRPWQRARAPRRRGPPSVPRSSHGVSGSYPSAVSQHLRVLHGTGLVTGAREDRRVLYRLGAPSTGAAVEAP